MDSAQLASVLSPTAESFGSIGPNQLLSGSGSSFRQLSDGSRGSGAVGDAAWT